jgi:hypothetical protein
MVKNKSLETTKLPGGNHSIPRKMVQFRDAFEELKNHKIYIEQVYPGRFRPSVKKENTLEIKGYCDQTSCYKIDINYEGVLQKFDLKVEPKNRLEFEKYIYNSLS